MKSETIVIVWGTSEKLFNIFILSENFGKFLNLLEIFLYGFAIFFWFFFRNIFFFRVMCLLRTVQVKQDDDGQDQRKVMASHG